MKKSEYSALYLIPTERIQCDRCSKFTEQKPIKKNAKDLGDAIKVYISAVNPATGTLEILCEPCFNKKRDK